jgi:predicted Rossmann-fold nucleotide-binding protein
VAGYWDPLLKLAEHFIAEEFADPSIRDFYTVQTTATDVLAYLAALRAENPDQL